MLSKILSRKNDSSKLAGAVSRQLIEMLEERTLLSAPPNVISVQADNRGQVIINLSRNVTGVSKSSVKLFTVGADGVIGDTDDVRAPAQVIYTASNDRITIKGKLTANAAYRVRLQANMIRSVGDDRELDGEFTGTFPSGDGKPGGNFAFEIKNDKSVSPTVRMSTTEGVINVKMDETDTPLSVKNFLDYANSGRYDSMFITRSIPGFIIQGGSLVVNSSDALVQTTVDAPVTNEFKAGVTSNTVGTIAFAKQGNDPNSATNQFFFNLADNSSNLDNQNGGFTTFGTISNPSGLSVMNAIAGLTTVVLKNPLSGDGVGPTTDATDLTTTPVVNQPALTGTTEDIDQNTPPDTGFVVTGGFDAKAQLVIFSRVAVLDKVIPVPA